jgi:hypothetical protein
MSRELINSMVEEVVYGQEEKGSLMELVLLLVKMMMEAWEIGERGMGWFDC